MVNPNRRLRTPRARRGERGQTATEYVLTISVLVIAMVAASSAFTQKRGPFHQGMQALSKGVTTMVAEPPDTSRGR